MTIYELQPTGAETPRRSDATKLREGVLALARQMRRHADEGDLSFTQTLILRELELHGPASPVDLAERGEVKAQSLTLSLRSLEDRGFVSRKEDPSDGRRHLLTITDLGRETFLRLRAERDEWLVNVMNDRLSEIEVRVLELAAPILDKLTIAQRTHTRGRSSASVPTATSVAS